MKSSSLEESATLRSTNKQEGKSSLFGGISNIANLIVGCGVIGLPGAVCRTGVVLSLVSLIGFYTIATWSANKIIKAKVLTKSTGYEEICQKLLGSFGYWMSSIAIWMLLLSVMWIYLAVAMSFQMTSWNIISKTHNVQDNSAVKQIGTFCFSFIVLPLACFRDLSFLSFTSTLGVFCTVVFIACSIVATASDTQNHAEFLDNLNRNRKSDRINYNDFEFFAWGIPGWSDFSKIMASMGAFCCAHACNLGVCSIYESLINPVASWKTVSFVGIGIAFICNLLVGFSVYISYNKFACANTDVMFTELFSKECSGPAFYFNSAGTAAMSLSRGVKEITSMPNWFFFGHLIFWGIATVLAIFVPKPVGVINFLGNFCCSIIMIILPILLDFEMNGGVVYFLSCGFWGSKEVLPDLEKRAQKVSGLEGNRTDVSGNSLMLGDLCRFTLGNALLCYGITVNGMSFLTLYTLFSGKT